MSNQDADLSVLGVFYCVCVGVEEAASREGKELGVIWKMLLTRM